jgi:peptidoglycan/LPS O-acetylase OafA/YrhL
MHGETSPPMETPLAQGRHLLPALLGLRGVAAVAVLLFHLHHLAGLPLPPALGMVGTHFGLGVQLFFVLSGFSLCHSTIHTVGQANWIRDYLLKRLFRIAPLFYLMIAVWVAFFWLRGVKIDLATLVLNLSFTFNFVPGKHESIVAAGWTIGVEMIFYAVLPVLLAAIRGLRAALVFLAAAALVSGAGLAALAGGGETLAGYASLSFVASLVVFATGIAAYHLWRGLPPGRGAVATMALVTLGLAALLSSPLQLRLLGPWRPFVMLWSLCFGGLVAWQAAAPARLLASWPLRFLGERSYGIYLLHPLLIVLLAEPIRRVHAASLPVLGDWAFLAAGGFVTAVVVAAAAATYALVEQPGIRAGRRLIGRLNRTAGDDPASPQPLPVPPVAASESVFPAALQSLRSGPGWGWATVVSGLAMLGFSAWVTLRAVDQPLVDIHAFRQTQTALTADWMVREGWRLDYQTPVAGAPWSLPLEFPLYQTVVAAVVAVTGCDLTATGRVVSWLFLVACGWPAFQIARRLRLPAAVPWSFCTLLWSAPLYVYWGRTFMIETAALFFVLACLPWWLDVVQGEGGWRSRWLFVGFATLAVLQKSTTGGPVLLVLLVVGLARWLWPGSQAPFARTRAAWASGLTLAALAAGGLWAAHSDTVKLANPLGRLLTAGGLSAWNFGTLAQKLDFQTWQTVVWERGFGWNAAGLLGAAVLAGFWAWPADRSAPETRRDRLLVLAGLTLFLLPILIFTNLHVVHEYYQVACVAFLLAALAVVLGSWLPRVTGLAAVTPLALVPFVLANIDHYRSAYGIVVARPLDQQDPLALERLRLGQWLREATPEGSGLVVFGQTWSSELPFHAGRKGCVCPTWYPDISRAWERPEEVLGGVPLGAIVISPEPDGRPSREEIAARVAAGGWRHDVVHGSDVLRPDPAVTAAAPPTDPGAPTTAPR